jgi:hypothetical protein
VFVAPEDQKLVNHGDRGPDIKTRRHLSRAAVDFAIAILATVAKSETVSEPDGLVTRW